MCGRIKVSSEIFFRKIAGNFPAKKRENISLMEGLTFPREREREREEREGDGDGDDQQGTKDLICARRVIVGGRAIHGESILTCFLRYVISHSSFPPTFPSPSMTLPDEDEGVSGGWAGQAARRPPPRRRATTTTTTTTTTKKKKEKEKKRRDFRATSGHRRQRLRGAVAAVAAVAGLCIVVVVVLFFYSSNIPFAPLSPSSSFLSLSFHPVAFPDDRRRRGRRPVLSLGLISDLQYVDKPDRYSVGSWRHYRHSLRVLEQAKEAWKSENVSQVLVLGDSIDRSNMFVKQGGGLPVETLKQVVEKLEGFKAHFILGNHDVESVTPRRELLRVLRIAREDEEDTAYYTVRPAAGIKLIVLDSFAISMHWPLTHQHRALAQGILREHRKHVKEDENLMSPARLRGLERRFVSLGGAIGEKQLDWLRLELQSSQERSEKVVLFTHIPTLPSVCSRRCGYMCLLWDYEALLETIRKHDCVKAFFAVSSPSSSSHDATQSPSNPASSNRDMTTREGIREIPTTPSTSPCPASLKRHQAKPRSQYSTFTRTGSR